MVRQVLSGDSKAFESLIRQYERLVLHIVTPLVGVIADREDICQDVFLKVYENMGAFQFRSKLGTWIGNIAYNASINFLRKKKNISVEDLIMPDDNDFSIVVHEMVIEESNAEKIIVRREELAGLSMAIDKLPEIQKSALLLFHFDDMSVADISVMLEMSENTVKSHLFRARKLLKESLIKNENAGRSF